MKSDIKYRKMEVWLEGGALDSEPFPPFLPQTLFLQRLCLSLVSCGTWFQGVSPLTLCFESTTQLTPQKMACRRMISCLPLSMLQEFMGVREKKGRLEFPEMFVWRKV